MKNVEVNKQCTCANKQGNLRYKIVARAQPPFATYFSRLKRKPKTQQSCSFERIQNLLLYITKHFTFKVTMCILIKHVVTQYYSSHCNKLSYDTTPSNSRNLINFSAVRGLVNTSAIISLHGQYSI